MTNQDIYQCAYDTEGCQMPELVAEIQALRALAKDALELLRLLSAGEDPPLMEYIRLLDRAKELGL